MAGFAVPLTRWFHQGLVAAGAKITVYSSGSTTKVTIYADADLATPLANPVTCDSNGEAVFFVGESVPLRFYVTTSGGTLIRDIDPVYPVPPLFGPFSNGQCQLTKSGSALLLSTFNGNKLVIGGNVREILSAGLSASGLSPDTLYYIYAYMNGEDVAIKASTSAPIKVNGINVNSAAAAETLVGMARTITGPAWQDTATQRFVRSWYNDPGIAGKNSFTTNRSTTSTTFAEINSEIRCEFLAWDGEVFNASATAAAAVASNGNTVYGALAFDSTTSPEWPVALSTQPAANTYQPLPIAINKTGLTRGYHYMTLLGATASGAVACTWFATSAVGTVPATAITLSSVRG